MTVLLRNLALPLDRDEDDLASAAAAALGVDAGGAGRSRPSSRNPSTPAGDASRGSSTPSPSISIPGSRPSCSAANRRRSRPIRSASRVEVRAHPADRRGRLQWSSAAVPPVSSPPGVSSRPDSRPSSSNAAPMSPSAPGGGIAFFAATPSTPRATCSSARAAPAPTPTASSTPESATPGCARFSRSLPPAARRGRFSMTPNRTSAATSCRRWCAGCAGASSSAAPSFVSRPG